MSAVVYSASRHGLIDDTTATGIVCQNINFDFTSEQARVENHIGTNVGLSVFNFTAAVTLDGVVASTSTEIVPLVSDVCALANAGSGTSNAFTRNLPGTHNANAGLVITGSGLTRNNKAFEMGNLTGEYNTNIATNAPSTLAD